MTTGRFLGIDYGKKRIGIAISDENNTLAFPKEIVLNDINAIDKIGVIVQAENVGEIVIGDSVDFSGKSNPLSIQIEVFVRELEEKFNLPVHREKEFLTSVEARKPASSKDNLNKSQAHSKMKNKKTGKVDASAAALILQRFLDRRNRRN